MRARIRLVRLGAVLMAGTLILAAAAETRESAARSKANESVAATIVDARRATAMPAWRPFLNEVEVYWLIFRLKQGDALALR